MRTTSTTLIVAAAALLATAAATAQQDPAQGPATVKKVMITMTVPSSEAIFTAASDPPTGDGQWVAVQKSAVTLADSGKLLMTGGRARDNAAWMERARALVDAAEAALKAAKGKNSDAMSKAGDDVYLTCAACHARYMDRGL